MSVSPVLDVTTIDIEEETVGKSDNPNWLETLAKDLPCLTAEISEDNKKRKTFEAAAK